MIEQASGLLVAMVHQRKIKTLTTLQPAKEKQQAHLTLDTPDDKASSRAIATALLQE